jgi:ribosomal-protein-alanine N-acetyltransferase
LIETERLNIRQFTKNDFTDLYDYLSRPEIYKYEPGQPISIEEAKKICIDRSKGRDFLAVELKQNHKMIGHLFFKQIEPIEFMTWELGYIFNPEYQRKGYGSEATKGLIEYGFNNYSIHRIMARCNPNNIASWKLLEKVGFYREAHFRQYAYFHKDSKGHPIWTDAYEYSIVRRDRI